MTNSIANHQQQSAPILHYLLYPQHSFSEAPISSHTTHIDIHQNKAISKRHPTAPSFRMDSGTTRSFIGHSTFTKGPKVSLHVVVRHAMKLLASRPQLSKVQILLSASHTKYTLLLESKPSILPLHADSNRSSLRLMWSERRNRRFLDWMLFRPIY